MFPDRAENTIIMVASGYDWVCPTCKAKNHEIETVLDVECENCGAEFEVWEWVHAGG